MIQYFDYNIKDYTTFGINAKVSEWLSFDTISEIQDFIRNRPLTNEKHFVIGGGSNLLFINDFKGLLIKPNLTYIENNRESGNEVFLKAGAGVEWDDFVLYTVEHGFWGAENLSLIPGTVGASPVQNIGAYGVEAKDIIYEVHAIHKETGEIKIFNNEDCQFAYRDSFFKKDKSQAWIVLEVTYKLKKESHPQLTYGALKQLLDRTEKVSLKAIRDEVVNIRESKLPDPNEVGNVGSFFKNPVVETSFKDAMLTDYPQMPFYKLDDGHVKLAAGWLIEQAGWKGYRKDDAGVHEKQALVLVNYGSAKGSEIYALSEQILDSIKQKFNVDLEREVVVIK